MLTGAALAVGRTVSLSRMKYFRWITMALIAAALLVPGSGLAQGGAAEDQYTEQIPTAGSDPGTEGDGGGSASGGGSDGSSGLEGAPGIGDPSADGSEASSGNSSGAGTDTPSSGGGPLSPETVKKLGKDPDGGAAAGLAKDTAPDSEATREAALQAQAGDEEVSTFGTTSEESESGVGMGVILLIILGATALIGAAYWTWRRRQDRDSRPGKSSPSTA